MSTNPEPSLDPPRHVVVNLDHELVAQALLECLQLAESLASESPRFLALSLQLRLRLSYALLHSSVPEFARPEVRKVALHHSALSTRLLQAQRLLHRLHQEPRSSVSRRE